MTRKNRRWQIGLGALVCATQAQAQQRADELFRDVEVRVIRQKFFQKAMRPEIGVQFNTVMNRSFVYSFLGNAMFAFHINEQLGVFGEGGVGFTMNKSDCSTLGEKFRIEPYVDDLRNWYGGGVTYTPVYGKYQLSSGELIYFDWFFNASGGAALMAKRAGTCIPESAEASTEKSVAQVGIATGQRYFLNKNTAATWSIKYMMVQDPLGGSIVEGVDNVLISLGASYFL